MTRCSWRRNESTVTILQRYRALFLPALPEQERIAAYLDASCAAIDAAVAIQAAADRDAGRRPKDIIQKLSHVALMSESSAEARPEMSGSTEMPLHWELVSLKRISEIQTGLTLGKEYEGQLIERPYLASRQRSGRTLESGGRDDHRGAGGGRRRVKLRPGDVLMTEGGDLDKLGGAQSGTARFRPACTKITSLPSAVSGTSSCRRSWHI